MTDAPAPPQLDLLLPQAGQAVDRLLRRAVAAHGLTPTSLGVLGVLARGRPVAHRELAAELGVAPATLTPVVDALERAGRVVRVRAAEDRRVVRVRVTDAGRERYLAAFTAVSRDLREHLPPPPPAVRAYLRSVLAALGGRLGDGSADADGRPAPPAVVEVEPGGEGAYPAVELDGQRHLGDVRPRVTEPDPAEAGR